MVSRWSWLCSNYHRLSLDWPCSGERKATPASIIFGDQIENPCQPWTEKKILETLVATMTKKTSQMWMKVQTNLGLWPSFLLEELVTYTFGWKNGTGTFISTQFMHCSGTLLLSAFHAVCPQEDGYLIIRWHVTGHRCLCGQSLTISSLCCTRLYIIHIPWKCQDDFSSPAVHNCGRWGSLLLW